MAYESERGAMRAEQCGRWNLLFDGYYLKLLNQDNVEAAWHARSGVADGGQFHYDAEAQTKSNVGPVPAGAYWIQPEELKMMGYYSRGWGVARVTIHPLADTETFGRGGFFIHGGATFGSKGCIDLAMFMGSFVEKLKTFLPNLDTSYPVPIFKFTTSCCIPLRVSYATESLGYPAW